MNPISATTLAAAMALGQAEAKEQTIQVFSPGQVPATQGASEFFVGDVYVDQRYQGTAPAAISGGLVSFTPGARTAWHTHPLGQTLYVVSGVGRVQMAGAPGSGGLLRHDRSDPVRSVPDSAFLCATAAPRRQSPAGEPWGAEHGVVSLADEQ